MMVARSFLATVLVVLGAFPGAVAEEVDIDALVGVYHNAVIISYYQADEGVIEVNDVLLVSRHGDGAYFHLSKSFDYGHVCEMSGIAAREGNALVFREDREPDSPVCVLRIVRQDGEIVVHDVEDRCQSLYCGARGYVSSGFLLNTRQPIEDMDELRSTPEYVDAVTQSAQRQAGPRQ